jgi:hypothetical protein
MEDSPSPVYGAALLMRFGSDPIRGSNPRSSAEPCSAAWRPPSRSVHLPGGRPPVPPEAGFRPQTGGGGPRTPLRAFGPRTGGGGCGVARAPRGRASARKPEVVAVGWLAPPRPGFGPRTGGGGCGWVAHTPKACFGRKPGVDPRTPKAGLGPHAGVDLRARLGRAGFVGKTGALERYFNVPCLPSSSGATPSSLAAGVRCGRRPQRVLLEAPVTALMHDRVPYRSPGAPNSPQSSDFGLEAQSVMLVLRMGVLRLTCGGPVMLALRMGL